MQTATSRLRNATALPPASPPLGAFEERKLAFLHQNREDGRFNKLVRRTGAAQKMKRAA